MICKKCHNIIDSESNFCKFCGEKLENPIENDSKESENTDRVKRNIKWVIVIGIITILLLGIIITIGYTSGNKKNNTNNNNKINVRKEDKVLSSNNNNKSDSKSENIDITINQVNSSNFPMIDVYFSAYNTEGTYIDNLKKDMIKIIESKDLNSEIIDFKKLNENEATKINLVMDTSGSMGDGKLTKAKEAAMNFLEVVKFDKGDSVELITFNDEVSINQFFTSNEEYFKSSIQGLSEYGQTCFYDALYTALIETNKENGPKCVIAFTDGIDNKSTKGYDEIIDLSNKLSIPIYIVGIGSDVDVSILEKITDETGGEYTSITDLYKLEDIYKNIYTKQKEQYVVSFKSKDDTVDRNYRNINLEVSGEYSGKDTIKYIPNYLVSPEVDASNVTYTLSEVEEAIYNYQHSFVDAVESNDFSEWAPYIDKDSSFYSQQENLVKSYEAQNIKVDLQFYNITDTEKLDDDNYRVEVYEKFYITYGSDTPAYKEFKNIYKVRNTSSGWKVSELEDIQTISEIKVNF